MSSVLPAESVGGGRGTEAAEDVRECVGVEGVGVTGVCTEGAGGNLVSA